MRSSALVGVIDDVIRAAGGWLDWCREGLTVLVSVSVARASLSP